MLHAAGCAVGRERNSGLLMRNLAGFEGSPGSQSPVVMLQATCSVMIMMQREAAHGNTGCRKKVCTDSEPSMTILK